MHTPDEAAERLAALAKGTGRAQAYLQLRVATPDGVQKIISSPCYSVDCAEHGARIGPVICAAADAINDIVQEAHRCFDTEPPMDTVWGRVTADDHK